MSASVIISILPAATMICDEQDETVLQPPPSIDGIHNAEQALLRLCNRLMLRRRTVPALVPKRIGGIQGDIEQADIRP